MERDEQDQEQGHPAVEVAPGREQSAQVLFIVLMSLMINELAQLAEARKRSDATS